MPISAYDKIDYAAYKPISFQEMWAPAQQLRQQHDQLQEEYAQQEQQGGLSLLGIDPVRDKAAYDIQQNFIIKTKEAADQLATKGFIDSGRRRGLMEIKSLYTNQVVPLQNQLKIRQEKADMLYKMKLQNPTYRATMDPNSVSLTDGLKDPNAFNFDGVSGNDLFSSVSKKAEQLSRVISQDHPKLISSGIFANYFTALQNGATLGQIDKAMKSDGKYNPQDVDKMTQMLHGIVGSTLDEYGVKSKFANNEAIQQELWNTAAQGLYSAAGTKQFGQMQDDMALYRKKKAEDAPPLEPPGKQFLQYDPSFEKQDLKKIDDNKNKLLNSISDIDRDIAHRQTLVNFGGTKEDIRTLNILKERKKSLLVEHNNLQSEYLNFAKASGIKIPKSSNGKMAKSDYESLISLVSEKMKEDYKSANKTRYFFNTKPETQQEFSSALSSMDKVVDINGDELSKSDILENGKLKSPGVLKFGTNGMYLQIVDKNNNSKTIPWNPEHLGNPAMSSDYTLLTNIKDDSKNLGQKDFEVKYGIPLNKSKTVIENLTTKISNGLNSQYTQTKTADIDPGYQQYQYGQQ